MKQYAERKYIISIFFSAIALIFISRLFYLQVLDTSYRVSAENNSRRLVTQYPSRGLIYDRNGKLLVFNQASYDLMVAPYQIKPFDTAEFCSILNISKDYLRKGIKQSFNPKYRREPLIKQISPETYAVLQEKMHKFPGFYVQTRTLRKYSDSIAAHLIGYVSEVNEKQIEKSGYYHLGDYIGNSGIEKSYEKYLRGIKGVKIYTVDVHGRIQGSYENGKYDKSAVVGKNIYSTIDADLQKYGEQLMQGFRGSVVAIEPSTGEILCLFSMPNYDPSLLVGRVRSENYRYLLNDTLKPLFDRALMAKYPPGSTFKLINGLIGLQEGDVFYKTKYGCNFGFYYKGIRVGCHGHDSPLNLPQAVQNSCNAYFCNVFKTILEDPDYSGTPEAFNKWQEHVVSFGFGKKLGIDMPNELGGFIPKASYFDRIYGEGHWRFITVRSLSIGQGELGITPLQMANMVTAIANKGYYYTPHVVKRIQDENYVNKKFFVRHHTSIDSVYFAPIIEGMELAVNGEDGGTARIARIRDITVCGKTGTAENPHGKDHSIFVAFAPKDDPKIALSVYVENSGYGSSYAAPIASLLIEKYLTDTIKRAWLETYVSNMKIKYQEKE